MFQYSKKAIISTIFILFFVLPACRQAGVLLYSAEAQNFSGKKENLVIAEPLASLRVGEKLQYTVEWLGINVGLITLEVKGIEARLGRDCFHVIARAQPNKFLSALYDIEYTVHSYIDKNDLYPLRFEKTRRLRDKFNFTTIDFDHENKKAKYKNSGNAPSIIFSPERDRLENEIAETSIIAGGVQDLLSSLYYLRLMKIEKDKNYTINVYYGNRNWPMAVSVGQPFLKDIRRKGTFAVFRGTVSSALSQFILGKSKLIVSFTADSRRIPLDFRLGTGMGPVTGFIQQIEAVE